MKKKDQKSTFDINLYVQKKPYQSPTIIRIGNVRELTMKTGSTSDSTLPRVV